MAIASFVTPTAIERFTCLFTTLFFDGQEAAFMAMQRAVEALIFATGKEIVEASNLADSLADRLVLSEAAYTRAFQALRCNKKELKELEAVYTSLLIKKEGVTASIKEAKEKIVELKLEIEHENKLRDNALPDLIPVLNVINAIASGDWTRAIPFVSSIRGLVSVIAQDKERFERRLSSKEDELENLDKQLSLLASKISKKTEAIKTLTSEVTRLAKKRDQAQANTSRLGKEVTKALSDVGLLQVKERRYRSIECDLGVLMEDGENDDIRGDMLASIESTIALLGNGSNLVLVH